LKVRLDMFLRKVFAPLAALACFALAAQSSSAAQQTFAATTADGANISTAFSYTTGPAGGLTIAPLSTFLASSTGFVPDASATLVFTGLANTGTVTVGPTDVQNLTGGTFLLKAGDGVTVLLSGTFTGAQLVATPPLPESQANFLTNVLGVTYTGGNYFTASGLINPGGFSFGLTSITPPVTLLGTGYFSSFSAGGSGTYSATINPGGGGGVPLPHGAALGLAALPALALCVRMRRKTTISL
jgi:hypothetical protein